MALTPKQRQKLLEKFLTSANNRMAALSEIVGMGVELDVQVVLSKYRAAVVKLVEQLEVDATGRLLASTRNAELLQNLKAVNDALRQTPQYIAARAAENTQKLIGGLSRWMGAATRAAGVMAEIGNLGDVMRGGLEGIAGRTTGQMFETGLQKLMADVGEGVARGVQDGLQQYATSKESLEQLLFSAKPGTDLEERAAEFANRAKAGAAELNRDIARIQQGQNDIEAIRDKLRKELDQYKADRKEWLKANPNGAKLDKQTDVLASRNGREAQKVIMDRQQDSMTRSAVANAKGVPVFVNAKNTDYDDNCFDAALEPPMTLAEWESSEFGPPRSAKRDCGEGCKCLLLFVGTEDENVQATGEDVSEFEPMEEPIPTGPRDG